MKVCIATHEQPSGATVRAFSDRERAVNWANTVAFKQWRVGPLHSLTAAADPPGTEWSYLVSYSFDGRVRVVEVEVDAEGDR